MEEGAENQWITRTGFHPMNKHLNMVIFMPTIRLALTDHRNPENFGSTKSWNSPNYCVSSLPLEAKNRQYCTQKEKNLGNKSKSQKNQQLTHELLII